MDDYRSEDGQKLGDLLSDGLHLTERVRLSHPSIIQSSLLHSPLTCFSLDVASQGYKLLSDLVLDHLASRSAALKPNGL